MTLPRAEHSTRFSLAGALDVAVCASKRPLNKVHLTADRFQANGSSLAAFIASSASTFFAFRSSLPEVGNAERRSHIARFSRMYRSNLAQLNDTSKAAASKGGGVFRAVEVVWYLCEVLVVDPQPPGILVQQLQQWAAAASGSTAKRLAAIEERAMANGGQLPPFTDADQLYATYWDAFLALIMNAQLADANALLRRHASWGREDFVMMSKLIELMEDVGTKADQQMQFLNAWNEWHDTVRGLLEEGRFFEDTEFQAACLLMIGDAGEFERRKGLCDSWFQFVVAQAAVSQPLVKIADLAKHAEQVLSGGDFTSSDTLSQLVLALFRGDLNRFARLVADLDDLWWTGAHLVDLLAMSGDLHTHGVQHVEERHAQLLQDYALCLLARRSSWQTALVYLQHCPSVGPPTLAAALLHVHCDTQQKALKVVATANALSLPEVAAEVARTQSVRWLKQGGRLDAALSWAIRSRNGPLLSRVAEVILEDFLQKNGGSGGDGGGGSGGSNSHRLQQQKRRGSGRLACSDQLERLDQTMLLSERLSFAAKYAEFLRMRDLCSGSGDPTVVASARGSACQLLLFLIESAWAPRFFRPRLLHDALELIEHDHLPAQNIGHLQQLMACLQNVVKEQPNEVRKDLLERLNFACAQKVADSLMAMMKMPNLAAV